MKKKQQQQKTNKLLCITKHYKFLNFTQNTSLDFEFKHKENNLKITWLLFLKFHFKKLNFRMQEGGGGVQWRCEREGVKMNFLFEMVSFSAYCNILHVHINYFRTLIKTTVVDFLLNINLLKLKSAWSIISSGHQYKWSEHSYQTSTNNKVDRLLKFCHVNIKKKYSKWSQNARYITPVISTQLMQYHRTLFFNLCIIVFSIKLEIIQSCKWLNSTKETFPENKWYSIISNFLRIKSYKFQWFIIHREK
jgi:hypothetical protein